MSRMGGSCSLQRQRALHSNHGRNDQSGNMNTRRNGNSSRRGSSTLSSRLHSRGMLRSGTAQSTNKRTLSVRHSVESEVPDHSISNLYPIEDNYILDDGQSHSKRSPKSLIELCTDAVCRNLPYLDGELPPGLPQDVVDDVVHSLMRHSALNATTLRALKNCELGTLSLVGCRGVTDKWLQPLSSSPSEESPCLSSMAPSSQHQLFDDDDSMDIDAPAIPPHQDDKSESSYSTSSFVSASSTPYVEFVDNADNNHQMEEEDYNAITSYKSLNSPLQRPQSPQAPMEDFMMTPRSTADTDMFPEAGCNYAASTQPLLPPQTTSSAAGTSPTLSPSYHHCHQHRGQMPSLTSHLTLLDLRGSQQLTDRGLLQLSDLSLLEIIKLDGCHSIVGKGLLAFSSSHRLHTLSLANCRRLTDEAIINISHLSSLEALSVDGCRCLTDRSLAAVSGLYELRKLDLSQCDLITNEGIKQLHELNYLEELSLGWCRCVTDKGVLNLIEQPGRTETLKVLRLARCPITDEGIQHVGRLTSLEELDLNGCSNVGSSVLGATLEKLAKLTTLDVSYCPGILRTSWQGKVNSLKTLELCYSSVRDAHLSRFTKLPALEELNLDSCPVGDWAISHLAENNAIPKLTSLDLADTDLTDLGMVHLPKFENLTRLSLFYCNISNAGLRHLASMTNLEVLNLDSREIGDEGLRHLRGLVRLRALDIFSGRVTDVGCAHISKIKSLESLELCGGGVGDLGCTLLASLDNLTSLNLSQNERITNRGAAALAALSNLKALNLSNTRVNSQALRFLSGLVKLQSLALYGCRGIDDGTGLDNLQNELPSLKCLRLNNSSSDDDGIVSNNTVNDDDDEDDDSMNGSDDDDEEEVVFQPATNTGLAISNLAIRRQDITANDDEDDDDEESLNDSDDNGGDDEDDDLSMSDQD